MNKILNLTFLFISFLLRAQSLNTNALHSLDNIGKFADHLFCTEDYLRAVGEYEKLLKHEANDTIEFKIILAYSNMGKYNIASEKYFQTKADNIFADQLEYEYYKILFRIEKYQVLQEDLKNYNKPELQKLNYLSYLFMDTNIPARSDFLSNFPPSEQNNISQFYNRKVNPPFKSPLLAGLLSLIIPGSGKIYVGEYGDGIVALFASTLFAFLSYDNFKANHNFRGWLFAGIGSFFYAGNIYGSVSSAQTHNARINYEFNYDLKHYLESKNYFLPAYEFCE